MTEQTPHHHIHPVGQALEEEAEAMIHPEGVGYVPPAEQMSIVSRLRQPKTLLSITVPLAILIGVVALNWKDMKQVPGQVAHANPLLLLAAFGIYYLGFPLRGWRWTRLLRGVGYRVKVKDGTEILFLSWLVNCIVPAKLGDLYRAYLLRLNSPVSATRTLGTVFMERIFDMIAVGTLGVAVGYWRWRGNLTSLPSGVQVIFVVGLILVLLLIVALIAMRSFGRQIVGLLPLPHRLKEMYYRFEEGVFGSVGLRGLPLLGLITGCIWLTEGLRLYFVVRALGFSDVDLGFSGAIFLALVGSLLTTIPFTPAGLGLVEGGLYGVLTGIFHATGPHAAAIILIDRSISVFSIVVLGSVAYMLSSKPRGGGIEVEGLSGEPGAATAAPSGA